MIHTNENQTETLTIPITSPPEAWNQASAGRRSFGLKTDVWSIGITAVEIINKRPILNDLTAMKELKGTKAMIPKQLLRDDITIGRSFGRTDNLWSILSKCWRVNPKNRPQVWEVYDALVDLLKYPLVPKERAYAFTQQVEIRRPSNRVAVFSWSLSDKRDYFLNSSVTTSPMCSQRSTRKLSSREVKAIRPE